MADRRDLRRSILERAGARLGRVLSNVHDNEPHQLGEPAIGRASGFGDPERPVQIFGRRSCFFTLQALALVRRAGLEHDYVELGGPERFGLLQKLKTETRHYTVPFVFVRGRFVGGFDDLEQLHHDGGLAALAAPAPRGSVIRR